MRKRVGEIVVGEFHDAFLLGSQENESQQKSKNNFFIGQGLTFTYGFSNGADILGSRAAASADNFNAFGFDDANVF